LASLVSRPSRAPRFTASTLPPRARSHTLVTSTPTPATTTPPSAPPSQASGLRAHTPCAPRRKKSSRLCAWSTPSSDTMFLVRSPTPRLEICLLTLFSPRIGRQAQERAQRQDAPCHKQRTKAYPSQQRIACRLKTHALEELDRRYMDH
jgi:hypothetical protein